MGEERRFNSLDGLRGIAALIVLVHHSLLMLPTMADSYYDLAGRSSFSLSWVLSYTPLHLFWAGTEAVYLFFVLSGMVLVLPAIRTGRRFSWVAYYPRRIIRLYAPVVTAVALGATIIFLVPRIQDPSLGPWVNSHQGTYGLGSVARDFTLVFGTSWIISPLWSLQWEVWFSILLPIFLLTAVVAARAWWVKLVGMFALLAVGGLIGSAPLFFLPIFGVGALLMARLDRLQAISARIEGKRLVWAAIAVVAIVLTTSKWILLGLRADGAVPFFAWAPVAGVTLLVLLGTLHSPTSKVLRTRPALWLGAVSFSLYLVHEPILVSVRMAIFPLPAWVAIVIAVPVSVLVAHLFMLGVERPSHRLAKRAGLIAETVLASVFKRASEVA